MTLVIPSLVAGSLYVMSLEQKLGAAESPRYPQTTQTPVPRASTSGSADAASKTSLTGKVSNFFTRWKKPPTASKAKVVPAPKRVISKETNKPSKQSKLRKPPRNLSHGRTGGTRQEPAIVNPSQAESIPLQVRPFKLDQKPSSPNPLRRVAGTSDRPMARDLNRERRLTFGNRPLQLSQNTPVAPRASSTYSKVPNPNEPTMVVPLQETLDAENVRITNEDDQISLIVRDAPVGTVLSLIAENQGLNIIAAGEVGTRVSITLNRVSLEDALNSILASTGYTWIRQNKIIIVSPINQADGVSSQVQGKVLRVFTLNYISATDVEKIVAGILSPAGKVFTNEISPVDTRRTQETLIVEDLPEYVERVAQYIKQIDIPPRQVLVEAHILEVDLRNEMAHGVNIEALFELAGADISFKTKGFANPLASPSFLFGIDGTDIDALLEALQTTSDAKTLASPKLMVLNGQDAKIQVGEQLGFLVTTTTETSTLQNVEFLDVGVVLNVRPQISDESRVLMTVKPEVSSGQINILTGLPEEETTEVETSVMLANGEAMVIGGLIKETDIEIQSKIPVMGDLWAVGRLFQKRTTERRRSEIIIVLVPHITPFTSEKYCEQQVEIDRALTPLLEGQLQEVPRPWEPNLPDAIRDPRKPDWKRIKGIGRDLKRPFPRPIEYYVPSVQEKYQIQSGFEAIHDIEYIETSKNEGKPFQPEKPLQPVQPAKARPSKSAIQQVSGERLEQINFMDVDSIFSEEKRKTLRQEIEFK